jgi:hypothetical protein
MNSALFYDKTGRSALGEVVSDAFSNDRFDLVDGQMGRLSGFHHLQASQQGTVLLIKLQA